MVEACSNLSMVSGMLNTEHLSAEVRKIIEGDGISVDEFAKRSDISRATAYSIIYVKRPHTQMAIGRKIAEGNGRAFRVNGDKIYFQKVTEATTEPAVRKELKRLNDALEGASPDMQKQILNMIKSINRILEKES